MVALERSKLRAVYATPAPSSGRQESRTGEATVREYITHVAVDMQRVSIIVLFCLAPAL